MKKFIICICIYIYSQLVYAVDVTVHLNGGILAQSCSVSSNDLIKNINFPDLNPGDFESIGSTSIEQSFSVQLVQCTGNVNNMAYQFSGIPDTDDTSLLKIIGKGENPGNIISTGLAIEILNENKKKVALNSKITLNEPITSSTYNLNFYLRYRSTSNIVSSGDASSVVYLDIYYE